MTSPLDIINRLYPKARITSGYRSPSNPLSRANPGSAHMHGTPDNPGAVDVAPIPGVNFDSYVASLRNAGLPVSGALDEAVHPKPWTTGPNWHVSLLGQSQQMPQRKPTLASIGKPDMGMAPVGLDASPAQYAPMSLADLQMPQGDIPQKHHSKFNLANIAGVLGDALMAYGGLQPQFGPNLAHQQDEERQMGFEREKFNAQLEAQRQRSLEPPQFVQNAQAWAALPPEMKRAVLTQQDAMNPINISTPQGTQNVARTSVKQVNGKTYYSIGGEWYEEGE